jgi:hypothetical protein
MLAKVHQSKVQQRPLVYNTIIYDGYLGYSCCDIVINNISSALKCVPIVRIVS